MGTREASLDPRLVRAVRSVLGDAPEGTEALGVDSLETAELVFALEEAFGVRLPDDAAFDTLADVARHVDAALERPAPARAPLDDGFGHLQWLAEAAIGRILAAYYRLEVHGPHRVPATGPVVLAMNHDSLLDIPILVLASPRRTWFMAKTELFRGALATWAFHALGGFPVRRGEADVRAVRAALDVIGRGQALAMYPEGTRAPHLQPFYPGAAWVAVATGAPLLPVAITGTADAMPKGSAVPKRTRVVVRFGDPMEVGRERDPRVRLRRSRELIRELHRAVEDLRTRT